MSDSSQAHALNSPAELVAVARAARAVGDRELERTARKELQQQFGISIKFSGREPLNREVRT